NPTTTSPSSVLPSVSSGVLKVYDVVVVSCSNGSYRLARVSDIGTDEIKVIYFIGPKYNIDIKTKEEVIIVEQIILVLDKLPPMKVTWYHLHNKDFKLIHECLLNRRILVL
ncbi:unnamed protein product, partial [Rotaria sordida]